MPSFERVLRELELHIAPDECARREVFAHHRGLDRARKEVAWIAFVAAMAAVAIRFIST